MKTHNIKLHVKIQYFYLMWTWLPKICFTK